MLFSMEQSILAEETLANLWLFTKSANVSTLQSFPLYGSRIESVCSSCAHQHYRQSKEGY